MSTGQKDTIYIDVDDEITSVIDKLHSSPHKIVALVLPKRAGVFQSVVNMKLLKRSADTDKKNLVLITSESAILPLAGAVGLHVARNLQSKPAIPPSPSAESVVPQDEPDLDKAAPVGALAGLPPEDEDETIEVDNRAKESPEAAGKPTKAAKKAAKEQKKKNKKLKIPNFEQFRTRLILGGVVLVLLIAGWIVAFTVMPKAKITLKTDTSNIDTNLTFAADPQATEVNVEAVTLPATTKEYRKTDTEKVPTTGQKDLGTKAVGTVTLSSSCSGGTPTIPAGTALSANNLGFVTTADVTVASFPDTSVGGCYFRKAVDVISQNPGEQYNLGIGQGFSVSGYSSVSGKNDAAFTGGTSKIVKIVSQTDVDGAKQKITDRAGTEAPNDLKKDLEEAGYFPLPDTLTVGNPTVTSTPNVGDEAADVTVTSTTVFTMVGVKKDDLKKLVEEDAKKHIDTAKQVIRDNGIDNANIKVAERKPDGKNTMTIQTTVIAGPQLDENSIKQEVAGKKRGDAIETIKKRPGIKDVEISYSPFWVSKTPKKQSKITIVFEQSDADAKP
jgi:hypothetical protein